jgi:exodeoxyribonuclease V gamma subunit
MLHVHRAERADALVDALGALLADPQADPFAREVVAVPTRGIERWVAQRLSGGLGASPGRGDGVCANVDFPTPRRLAGEAVAAASGVDPAADPWLPERLVWPLLEIVEESRGEPWLPRLEHRFAAVRRIAELLDRYALHRPGMLRAWVEGEDGGWQGELWRRLVARVPGPDPARRLEHAGARLRAQPGLVDLPERLSLFGLTRLPTGRLDVVRALAAARDVHLFLLHPSPALWAAVDAAVEAPVVHRATDPTARLARNPLLASWGHDAREMQLVLGAGADGDHHHPAPPRARAGTLLACRPACAPTSPRATRCRCTRTTAPSRSTPATVAPARSRCCATPSCTSSPRTRRSSPAT